MRLLESAKDVTDEVVRDIEDTLGWFESEPRLDTEEFIDRLASAGNLGTDPYDIESYDNPAVRKIMRIARRMRRD